MNNIDKKQLPKLIVLGVLMVAFIGYVSFQALSPGKSAPSKPPKQKSSFQATNEEASTVGTNENVTLIPIAIPYPRRDPFLPVGALANARNKTDEPSNPAIETAQKRNDNLTAAKRRINTALNPFVDGNRQVPPINPFDNQNGTSGMANKAPNVKDPPFVMTGVIRGSENVAIIKAGDSERYVVKKGQRIGGSYVVESVTSDGAVLVNQNRRIHVKLGGA